MTESASVQTPIRAITLWQPWATLIGSKRIETRSWSTSYRGALAIHAAAVIPSEVRYHVLGQRVRGWGTPGPFAGSAAILNVLHRLGYRAGGVPDGKELPLGSVVATCDLVDVLPIIDEAGGGSIYGARPSAPYPFVKVYGDGVLGIIRDDHSVAEWIDDQRPFGDFTPGRFAWLLDNIQRLDPPIPARGRQGFWEWKT